jgi:hypothetical protein
LLHELGGHGGLENMMNPKQYADLMRQFDRLVAQEIRLHWKLNSLLSVKQVPMYGS